MGAAAHTLLEHGSSADVLDRNGKSIWRLRRCCMPRGQNWDESVVTLALFGGEGDSTRRSTGVSILKSEKKFR